MKRVSVAEERVERLAALPPTRDAWEKADIILEPVGGLLTALAVAVLGFWTSSFLREREARESAFRERMQTSGDQHPALLRADEPARGVGERAAQGHVRRRSSPPSGAGAPRRLERAVLNLELLVYNFHESLNLKPLFLHLERLARRESPQRAEYVARLNRVAEEVTKKQMLIIEEGGRTFDATANLKTLSFASPDGLSEVSAVARDLSFDGIHRATSSSRSWAPTPATSRFSCA